MHPWEFFEYTLEEYLLRAKGFDEARLEQWHHTRFLAFTMAKPHLKNQRMKIDEFLPLPGDKKFGKGRKLRDMTGKERYEYAMQLKRATLGE